MQKGGRHTYTQKQEKRRQCSNSLNTNKNVDRKGTYSKDGDDEVDDQIITH